MQADLHVRKQMCNMSLQAHSPGLHGSPLQFGELYDEILAYKFKYPVRALLLPL